MDTQILSLPIWESFTEKQQEEIGHEILSQLPHGFAFRRIYHYELGSQHHPVAIFSWKHIAFCCIPGGTTTLGYDPRFASPSNEQRQDWEREAQDAAELSIDDFLAENLTPLREVIIKPFLIQALPIRLGPAFSGMFRSDDVIISHQDVALLAQENGFRFATSDEWEYACAAGSKTLFRWGNDCPLNEVPSMAGTWQLHRRPSAFGVVLSSDPYDWEFCQESNIMRGGDGGVALHSGVGNFAGWLSLASSYVANVGDSNRHYIRGFLRQALSLDIL